MSINLVANLLTHHRYRAMAFVACKLNRLRAEINQKRNATKHPRTLIHYIVHCVNNVARSVGRELKITGEPSHKLSDRVCVCVCLSQLFYFLNNFPCLMSNKSCSRLVTIQSMRRQFYYFFHATNNSTTTHSQHLSAIIVCNNKTVQTTAVH